MRKLRKIKLLATYGFFFVIFIISINKLQNDFAQNYTKENFIYKFDKSYTKNGHRLAIVVPYRDRLEELNMFVPHMSKFLLSKNLDFKIFIVNQIDSYRFNRATLINIGFAISKLENFDYLAMHDIDLLPLNQAINYSYPSPSEVLHLTPSGIHPRYNYPTFIGGILLISHILYQQVNGMSNRYWGWGLEDDEFYIRLKEKNIKVLNPQNITTGKKTFLHNHDKNARPRDMRMSSKQYEISKKRDHLTGLNNLPGLYTVVSRETLYVDKYPYEMIEVVLYCDEYKTPWCKSSS